MRGTVKVSFAERGYGWIKPDAKPHDVFAHIRDVAGQPCAGARVDFKEHEEARRPCATDIKVVS
jgi:cold shock CspA family protein